MGQASGRALHYNAVLMLRPMAVAFLVVAVSASQPAPKSLPVRARDLLPPIHGRLAMTGLKEPVNVLRDRWGVAHIYAQNEHDLFFAQGFVVSQDRLFQMELWKRSGQGRLAEILGPSAVKRDVSARLLRFRGDMNA